MEIPRGFAQPEESRVFGVTTSTRLVAEQTDVLPQISEPASYVPKESLPDVMESGFVIPQPSIEMHIGDHPVTPEESAIKRHTGQSEDTAEQFSSPSEVQPTDVSVITDTPKERLPESNISTPVSETSPFAAEEQFSFMTVPAEEAASTETTPNQTDTPSGFQESVITDFTENEENLLSEQALNADTHIPDTETSTVSLTQTESDERTITADSELIRTDIADLPPNTEVILETGPQAVSLTEQTITLFSYKDAHREDNKTEDLTPGVYPEHGLSPVVDLPYVPLESINLTQLIEYDAAGLVQNTSDTSEKDPQAHFKVYEDSEDEIISEQPDNQEIIPGIPFPEPFPLILNTEQEVVDQIFRGIEDQNYQEEPIGVFVLPMEESVSDESSFVEDNVLPEVIVFVWNEALFENLTMHIAEINEVIEDFAVEEQLDGMFYILFDSNPEVADEELKNDTFGKYDDTVILLWYIIKMMALFGQAMLYIDPRSLIPEFKYPSHNIGSLPISDQEDHIST
ncbi:hypothetical protein IPM65_01805 [Candidatus Roizmanbacteria bacterium]|nr:MAG: hypothetical protein IPM65_01805 [Candidatus Roizmanbacteria bacterium]